jgi:translation elongation factor EF-4
MEITINILFYIYICTNLHLYSYSYSAKNKIGVLEVLESVVDRLPYPGQNNGGVRNGEIELLGGEEDNFLGRIVDSWFDEHRGVVSLVQVVCERTVNS